MNEPPSGSEDFRKRNPHLFPHRAAWDEANVETEVYVGAEAILHGQIIQECRRRRWLFFHGAMHKASNRTSGEPDFTILADNGRVLFIECKTKTGKLSPDQQAVVHQAQMNNHRIWIVRSVEEFLRLADADGRCLYCGNSKTDLTAL